MSFLGTGARDADQLARSLASRRRLISPTAPPDPEWSWAWADDLAAWRNEIEALPSSDQVVVCTWVEAFPSIHLVELDPMRWLQQVEWPTALWFTTLVAAVGRCRDGGSVVAVLDRPATLDAIGRGPAVVVAEGVINLVRSLAAREGGRGVRVNAVMSSRHSNVDELLGSPPPLATFPDRIDVEVAGAVRLLLSDDSVGITGSTVSATSGRR
jgi:NAD(P)-dependent dehydrogenase (short-subunit alcohol dehydrogenase family)